MLGTSCYVAAMVLLTCAQNSSQVPGRYYSFGSGKKPTSNVFSNRQAPIARLTLTKGGAWSLEVIMADTIPKGSWTIKENTVTLVSAGSQLPTMHFRFFAPDRLEPVRDAGNRLPPGASYKMPPQWEASFQRQHKHDAYLVRSRDLAKAAVICAEDHGDTLPRTQKAFERQMLPYVVKPSAFKDFVYTFKGGKLPPESKRGKAQLGYLKAPGGRVVAYLDGSAKWVATK